MDDIRYFKLHNRGAFVARIHILYKAPSIDDKGNISYPAEFSEWKQHGYNDICAGAERTVDLLKDANMSDGTVVKLRVVIPLGKSREASEQFMFQSSSGKMASYEITGTTLISHLKLISVG